MVVHKRGGERQKKTLFPADEIANQISSCIERDLSQVPLFDRTCNSVLLSELRTRQIAGTLKRYQRFADYDRSALNDRAFEGFTDVNNRMSLVNDKLRTDSFWDQPVLSSKGGKTNYTYRDIRTTVQYLLQQVLGTFWWDEFHTVCKHGSGSTLGVSFEDTSVDKKFMYPLTCTSEARSLFEIHTRRNTALRDAVEILNGNLAYGEKYDIVDASRATTVDKTSSKRRMIAIEPTLNMFFQQGLMTLIYARLLDIGLDLGTLPQRHRDIARASSITRRYGTIDLAQASDSVAYELIRQFFPPGWFRVLNMVRTPSMEIGGVKTTLHMFSTMGNATTFPLETLVFWAIACACHHIQREDPGHLVSHSVKRAISVFGDDCIVPTESCDLFVTVITNFGFQVNEEKTFIDPDQSFRESCGGDYFHGFDVRPYSFRAPRSQSISELEPWLYTILNNILPTYTKYFGYYQSVLAMSLGELMVTLFTRYKLKFKLVPEDFPDDAGFRCKATSVTSAEPSLELVSLLATQLGFVISPILRSESGVLDFAYVRFAYRKSKPRNEFIRYAVSLYKMTESELEIEPLSPRQEVNSSLRLALLSWAKLIDDVGDLSDIALFLKDRYKLRRSPIRKKGGYVVARTTSRFY